MFLSASLLLVPRFWQTGRGNVSTLGPGVSSALPALLASLLACPSLAFSSASLLILNFNLLHTIIYYFHLKNPKSYHGRWTSWLEGRGGRTDGAEHCLGDPLGRQVAAASTCINLIHYARALIDLLFRFID